MITIEPITPHLGAEIRGVFETGAPRDEIARVLRRALLAHHLLVVRARILRPPELIALGSMFGELVQFANPTIPEHQEIFWTSNQRGQGLLNVGQHWHVDGTMHHGGTPISVWHVIEHPAEGGDTLYASMHRAYEELPEDLRARVDNLQMVAVSGAKHALVKRHPATRRKALYTNINLTDHFIGMDKQQTKALLDRLDAHLDRPGGHYQNRIRASRGTPNIEALPLPEASGALYSVDAVVTNAFVSLPPIVSASAQAASARSDPNTAGLVRKCRRMGPSVLLPEPFIP